MNHQTQALHGNRATRTRTSAPIIEALSLKRTFLLMLLFAAGAFFTIPSAVAAEAKTDMQKVKEFKYRKTTKADLKYLLFLPKDYQAHSQKRWPLIFFLHGAGERGSNVWKVAVHGPPKIVAKDPDFPFIVVSPQCPEGQIWSSEALLGLLDNVEKKLNVDTGRVYLTGLSMGGYGSWDLGLRHPDRFAAIVPICGGGQLISVLLAEGTNREALKSLGVWAFHGGKDPVVPLVESQRMADFLKKSGVQDVKLTVYPEAGHDSWTEAYNDPELYKWLLRHERKAK
jgi:predicted peptidase